MHSNFTLCYRHTDFVVINKPAGISVHKDEQAVGFTEIFAKQLGVEQVWLVHRLDKVTSGLLMLALNKQAAATLSQLFATRQIQKTYWALITDKPKKKQGKIIGDMAKSRDGAWKLCHSKTNPAITEFSSVSLAPHLRHVVLHPKTGKTHQLRVAMRSLGSPILGDNLYGGKSADRVYLHAYQIAFIYQQQPFQIQCLPESGEWWHFLNP